MFSSRKNYKHICVSKTMRDWLKKEWKISATVVYDKPAKHFKELSISEKHDFFAKFFPETFGEENIFSTKIEDDVILNLTRPAIIVSSTSWTKDEDFSILLKALRAYDKTTDVSLPDLYVIITGKGPMKEYYQNEINDYKWIRVTIKLAWLKMEDYPKLLGSADLGISLHYSSSGIDLPMKVVDMFGCCLPCLAIRFKALKELVRHNENGLVFADDKQLLNQLKTVLANFPVDEEELIVKWRDNLRKSKKRWDDEWEKIEGWFK